MRFLADENFPKPSVRLLRDGGIEVDSVMELAPGSPDEEVLSLARENEQVLLTFDRDFGELIYRRASPVPAGLVYFRLPAASPEEPANVLIDLLSRPEIELVGRFTVVDGDRVRQRPLLGVI